MITYIVIGALGGILGFVTGKGIILIMDIVEDIQSIHNRLCTLEGEL